VLTYNGTEWEPAAAMTAGAASGDLGGTYPNPSVARIQGTPVASTAPTSGQVLSYNGNTWTPAANTVSGAASGDLGGTYPNPSVARIQGTPVVSTVPTSGQVLSYNGAAWAPAAAGAAGAAGGDLGGTYPNPTVAHLQGVISTTNGFAVTGTQGSGTIPASGPGVRLMWYPGKAAFRAGDATSTEWDDGSIGVGSVALGVGSLASGLASTALGTWSEASGDYSMALGNGVPTTLASGTNSIALGNGVASGISSMAVGTNTVASGDYSTAMGNFASTNHQAGSFVIGDGGQSGSYVQASGPNQFVVRASGGFQFRTSDDLSTGCNLPAGSGSWACTSSRLLKTDFETLDGEIVLARVRELPVELWSYKTEPGVRHLGTFAEDFHRAFGLGPNATTIGSIDMDGVNLAAVKALDQRTRNLQEQLVTKDQQITGLNQQITELRRRLERLEAAQH
jgi:hypothetical protein